MTPHEAYLRALRTDYMVFYERVFATVNPGAPYADSWHLHAIGEQLRQVDCGLVKRLIVNVPPRSGKSILTSIGYSAWRHGRDPRARIICVSSDDTLVRSLAAAYRVVVGTEWFREAFPAFHIRRGSDRATETITTRHGYRYGVSIGGSVLGRGADLIIADDAMSATAALSDAIRQRQCDLWDTAFQTRLDNKSKGAIIIVSQRLHEEDLVGHVTQGVTLMADPKLWTMLVIPAIAAEDTTYKTGPGPQDTYRRRAGEVLLPDREPREVLEGMRTSIGSMTFAAQYQQDPVPADGNVIKREWLCHVDSAPASFERTISSWDLASTLDERSSYSVGQRWGVYAGGFYLLDVVRRRLEAPALRRLIMTTIETWQADANIVEETELGRTLVQDLRTTERAPLLLHKPKGDKQARLLAQSARFEARQVFLPADAPWLADYIRELLAFPFGRHDDQVDATSQALHYLTRKIARSGPIVRGEKVRRDVVRRDVIT